jgi:hypothetical protein
MLIFLIGGYYPPPHWRVSVYRFDQGRYQLSLCRSVAQVSLNIAP